MSSKPARSLWANRFVIALGGFMLLVIGYCFWIAANNQ